MDGGDETSRASLAAAEKAAGINEAAEEAVAVAAAAALASLVEEAPPLFLQSFIITISAGLLLIMLVGFGQST
jgi:hypothetical protein